MKKRPQNTGKPKVHLEEHELETLRYLRAQGLLIKLIPNSKKPGERSPDYLIGDRYWEVKAPIKTASSTIEHAFKSASGQAENVIFDLRRLKVTNDQKQVAYLKRLFKASKRVQRLKIITKSGELQTFEK